MSETERKGRLTPYVRRVLIALSLAATTVVLVLIAMTAALFTFFGVQIAQQATQLF